MGKKLLLIGTIYALGKKYRHDYDFATVYFDQDREETVVKLKSRWCSIFDVIEIHGGINMFDAMNLYR